MVNAPAQHGIDIDVKVRVLRQNLELFIEHLQAFFGDIVGHDVVDADLQVIQPGFVQLLYATVRQQIAVGNEPGEQRVLTDGADDFVQVRMQQRLAAAEGNDAGFEAAEQRDAVTNGIERHGFRVAVVLVAIGAGEITAADRDNMRHDRMVRTHSAPDQQFGFAKTPTQRAAAPWTLQVQFGHSWSHFYCKRSVKVKSIKNG